MEEQGFRQQVGESGSEDLGMMRGSETQLELAQVQQKLNCF